MQQDIEHILIHRDQIARRINDIAQQITQDFATEGSAEITLVPILTGSIIFVADLIRLLPIKMLIRLISISSYLGSTTTSKAALIQEELTHLPQSLENAHVLIIDDILDSGQTIDLVTSLLLKKNPASIKTCVLLRKDRPNTANMPIDYVCFDSPDEFVVGYGLDYNDYYRNLPDIVTLHPRILQADN